MHTHTHIHIYFKYISICWDIGKQQYWFCTYIIHTGLVMYCKLLSDLSAICRLYLFIYLFMIWYMIFIHKFFPTHLYPVLTCLLGNGNISVFYLYFHHHIVPCLCWTAHNSCMLFYIIIHLYHIMIIHYLLHCTILCLYSTYYYYYICHIAVLYIM